MKLYRGTLRLLVVPDLNVMIKLDATVELFVLLNNWSGAKYTSKLE